MATATGRGSTLLPARRAQVVQASAPPPATLTTQLADDMQQRQAGMDLAAGSEPPDELTETIAATLRDHTSHGGGSTQGTWWNADCLAVDCHWTTHGNRGGIVASIAAHDAHKAAMVAAAVRAHYAAALEEAREDVARPSAAYARREAVSDALVRRRRPTPPSPSSLPVSASTAPRRGGAAGRYATKTDWSPLSGCSPYSSSLPCWRSGLRRSLPCRGAPVIDRLDREDTSTQQSRRQEGPRRPRATAWTRSPRRHASTTGSRGGTSTPTSPSCAPRSGGASVPTRPR